MKEENNYLTYLAGPIDRVNLDAAMEWREWLTEQLKPLKIGVFNPFGKYGGDRLAENRKNLSKWNKIGDLDSIRKFVSEIVIPPDLEMVELCNFVTLYVPKKSSEVCGSYGEGTLAFYLGIPVYIVTKRKVNPVELPNWIIGCSTKIFTDWDSYIKFIKEKYV